MTVTLRFEDVNSNKKLTRYDRWNYLDKEIKPAISQEEIDKAKAEFQPAVKVITQDDVIGRKVPSGHIKRGGWHGASPGEKASGIKGEVEEC